MQILMNVVMTMEVVMARLPASTPMEALSVHVIMGMMEMACNAQVC